MEYLNVIAYPIKITESIVFKLSFITLVTNLGVFDVKINGLAQDYKYNRYLDYTHLCELSLVRTRNNWIIKEFISAEQIIKPSKYSEYLKISFFVKNCFKYLKKSDDNFLPLIKKIVEYNRIFELSEDNIIEELEIHTL